MSLGDGSDPDDGSDPSDGDRRRRLLDLVATSSPAGSDGADAPRPEIGPHALVDRLGRVCSVASSELCVSGAGVMVMGSVREGLAGHRTQLGATGAAARHLEDLQLTTGEGPCLDAFAGGAPVLAGDLTGEPSRWLAFGPEALAAGVAAVFSFPLQVGAVRLGTLDLHRDRPGPLSRDQLAGALVLAQLATEALLELAEDPTEPDAHDGRRPEALGWLPAVHAEVHQASGMVAARAGIPVGWALLRIRAHAFGRGVSITDVARRILAREIVLDDDAAPGDDAPPRRRPDPDPDPETGTHE